MGISRFIADAIDSDSEGDLVLYSDVEYVVTRLESYVKALGDSPTNKHFTRGVKSALRILKEEITNE
jgi:hypothetical protein